MTMTEYVIIGLIVLILAVMGYGWHLDSIEKDEFMAYCQGKGYSAQDCRWEQKRLENGQKSTLLIMPMYTGR